MRELSGPDGEREGWLLTWHRMRADRDGKGTFEFNVSAFIRIGMRRVRAAEVVLQAYERFLCHELRESFRVGYERLFDPHANDERLESE